MSISRIKAFITILWFFIIKFTCKNISWLSCAFHISQFSLAFQAIYDMAATRTGCVICGAQCQNESISILVQNGVRISEFQDHTAKQHTKLEALPSMGLWVGTQATCTSLRPWHCHLLTSSAKSLLSSAAPFPTPLVTFITFSSMPLLSLIFCASHVLIIF